MPDLARAKAIRAAGRLSGDAARLVVQPVPCDACRKAGAETPALAVGRTKQGEPRAFMCGEHFSKQGVGLGAGKGEVLIVTGALPMAAPPETQPVGYSKAIIDYQLAVLPPNRLSFLATRGGRRERVEEGRTIVIYSSGYAPGDELTSQLEFAVKYEGVNLEVLTALFRRVDRERFEKELTAFVRERPTGKYSRRLWFLYERLTERRLPLKDVTAGNYVPLLDPKACFTGPPRRSRRHRVVDNLLGSAKFSPMVRRTATLAQFGAAQLAAEAARIVEQFDEDAIRRAVSYLYTKETRSSFDIEGERPGAAKTERFVGLLREVPRIERLSRAELIRLQNATVDARFADRGYRADQVYVGEQLDPTWQKIHFVGPTPDDVPSLMEGLLDCQSRLDGSGLDAIVHAAAVSFGFVFIHPFSDGNGRLHRLLIHYILSRAGFTPKGLIFPVSAVMLQRRLEYDECLEAFSVPLMRLVEYEENEVGVVTVKNDTASFYRYFDATPMAEALYRWVQETVRDEFRGELEFVVRFRDARRAIESIVELPDRLANLFIKICLQNDGRLSAAKRKAYFSKLTDAEVKAMEKAVQEHLLKRNSGKEHDSAKA
jgi:hypothetical protein